MATIKGFDTTAPSSPSNTQLPAPSATPLERAKSIAQVKLARRALARRSFIEFARLIMEDWAASPFIEGWFTDELYAELEKAATTEDSRLLLEAPPRVGKSLATTRLLSAWYVGLNPNHEVTVATYGQTLSDSMGRDVRSIMQCPTYTAIFPLVQVDPKRSAADNIGIKDKRGVLRFVGAGGALTGTGAHLMILDDLIKDHEEASSQTVKKSRWEWYTSTARSRVMPGGKIITIGTRWAEDDVQGMILDMAKNGGEQFTTLSYPALAIHTEEHRKEGEALHPARYDGEYYKALRSSIPPKIWSALYQCNPVPEDGIFFDSASTENSLYKLKDAPDFSQMRMYLPCDAALSTNQRADFTCAWPFGVDKNNDIWFHPTIYLHKRGVSSLDIVEWLLKQAKELKVASVVLERGHISLALGPLYKKRAMELGIYAKLDDSLVPKADKMVRAQPIEGRMRQGKVHLPDMPWVREVVIPQLLAFPDVKHDDVADTMALAGLLLDKVVPFSPPKDAPSSADPPYLSMDWIKKRAVKAVKRGMGSLF